MTASNTKIFTRRNMITLRTTDDEKNAIRARANAYGLSVGAFIREVTLDKLLPKQPRFTKEQGQFVALILSSLGNMMGHIRKLDQDQHASDLSKSLAREILLLRDQCFEVIGRRP
jgi:uncharacterized protein (DUF1778 family)